MMRGGWCQLVDLHWLWFRDVEHEENIATHCRLIKVVRCQNKTFTEMLENQQQVGVLRI